MFTINLNQLFKLKSPRPESGNAPTPAESQQGQDEAEKETEGKDAVEVKAGVTKVGQLERSQLSPSDPSAGDEIPEAASSDTSANAETTNKNNHQTVAKAVVAAARGDVKMRKHIKQLQLERDHLQMQLAEKASKQEIVQGHRGKRKLDSLETDSATQPARKTRKTASKQPKSQVAGGGRVDPEGRTRGAHKNEANMGVQ